MTGFRPYLFQGRTSLSDDDPLLRITFHINDSSDVQHGALFPELFHLHFHRIWNLLLVIQQDLFPDDFLHEKPFAFIGQFIFRKIGGIFGKPLQNLIENRFQIEFLSS